MDQGAGGLSAEPTGFAATKRILPLALVAFLGFLTIGIPLPVLPVQVHDVLGFGTVTVGWVVGIQSVATLLTRQFAGSICDAQGPRRAVLAGLPLASAAGLSYLVSALPGLPPAGSLLVLIAGRLLLGMAESLFLTGVMAWNIARVGARNTGRVMVWQGMAMYGALGGGSVAGLAILPVAGFAGVAVAATAVPLLGLAIAASLPATPITGGRRLSFWRVIGRIWQPGMVLALSTMPYGAMAAFLALDYGAHGWGGAGAALAAYAVCFIAIRMLLPGVTDRLSGGPIAAACLAVTGIGQIMLWAASMPAMALAGAAVTGAGSALLFPAMGVAAVRRVPPQNRGLATGAYAAFWDVGVGTAGPVTGAVAGWFGYPAVFLAGAVAALVGAVLALSVTSQSAETAGRG